MRKAFKRVIGAGLLAGILYTAWRAWHARRPGPREVEWSSAPFPFPPVPRPATGTSMPSESPATPASSSTTRAASPSTTPAASPSTAPADDGSCPVSHPVKGKLQSGIYHVPGGANYERTRADRCYVDEDAAVRDGLRRSKV